MSDLVGEAEKELVRELLICISYDPESHHLHGTDLLEQPFVVVPRALVFRISEQCMFEHRKVSVDVFKRDHVGGHR